MFQIKQSEATAARRRIPVLLVDITDGFTPETGVVTPTINISKNGGTSASGAGTWTEIGNGQYYYEFTSGEVDTLGWIAVNIEKATVSRDYNAICQIMAYDYAVATNLGLSALPTAAPNAANGIITFGTGTGQLDVVGGRADADVLYINGAAVNTANAQIGVNVVSMASGAIASIWNALTSGLTTASSIGKLLVDNVNATISSRSTLTAANVWDYLTSAATTVGSLGKLLVDNLNATISSRATDTGVWAAATRTLTSGANIALAKGTGVTGFNDIAATDVWAATTRTLSSGTNIVLAKGTGVTGFNDITSQSVWDVLTANVTAVNSIGVQLKTNIDVATSTRLASASYTAPPSAATISTQVWTEPIPGSFGAGTAGNKLNSAASAGDPWSTALPGAYATGTAGNILGNRLDAAITTRLASASYTAPPSAATISTQVWSETLPGSYTSTQAGFKLNAAGSAADPWSTTLPGSYSVGSAGYIIGNNLNATVGSRMATFTLPTNFSLLAISGSGGVTAGTVSDKTGYSLSGTQTFNLTGNITGSLSGSVGSVTGNVSGSVASVTGNVGGNVSGSVNSVVGNVGGNVVGSVGSVTGSVGSVTNPATIWDHLTSGISTTGSIGLLLKTNVDVQISSRLASTSYTAAPTVTQIWQQALPGTFTTGQAGFILGTNLDAQISSRLASTSYSAAPSTTAITSAIWNQARATANGGSAPVAGTFGYYLDSRVSTAGGGGGGGGGVLIKQGPFKLSSTNLGPNNVLDLVVGDNRNIQLSVVDENNENIPLNASYTHSVKTYDISGALVATYTGTIDYANGGLVSFNIDTTTTNTSGTYNTVLVINDGASDTIYGGLLIEVRL